MAETPDPKLVEAVVIPDAFLLLLKYYFSSLYLISLFSLKLSIYNLLALIDFFLTSRWLFSKFDFDIPEPFL